MDKKRLLELAGINEGSMKNLMMDIIDADTDTLAKLVAEHMWHNFMQDDKVDEFFEDVKRQLAFNRKRSNPEK